MYSVYVRYFNEDSKYNDSEYSGIIKIQNEYGEEYSGDKILNFKYDFKSDLYLYSKDSTYIVSYKDIRAIEITKN